MSGARVAVYGGSFNPPHMAHVLAVTTVLACFDVDEVLVVPTFAHPFGKALAPYEDRVRMCELAMGWLPGVRVSRVEQELGGESRTLRTLEHLAAQRPDARFRFVMGADLVLESSKWHAWDRVVALAPPIVLGRVGVTYEGAPVPVLPDVSSTDVRTRIAQGDAGAQAALSALVPKAVLAYVAEHGLYR